MDELGYVVLDYGSDEVAACLHAFESLLRHRHVHYRKAAKGARITDLASVHSTPLIVGVVNEMPIKVSKLPADLAAFFSEVESFAPMMLCDPEQFPDLE